ncbi:MAG: HD domain-containing protein [Bacteroidetes bacterium]|nr:HD domain-containing protein [Bacteroidota bacterium]MCL5026968.1 HD domain-containing protein [Chloroflexota bacterium]
MADGTAYVPLDLWDLRTDLSFAPELYINEGGRYVLYRAASLPFGMEDCERLLASGVTCLWIPVGVDAGSRQHLMSLLSLPDQEVPPATKSTLLYGSATAIAERTMASTFSEDSLPEVQELVEVTASYLAQSRAGFAALLSVMHHDFSVYSHAVNVATYALALGRFIGIVDHKDLQNLGLGAILHDTGKIKVPKEVLNKPGPLSGDEWDIIHQHPLWGAETLRSMVRLPEIVPTIVIQHHERLDGSGYPMGLRGEDLHLFSVIVALVDSYDALTGQRPYRLALTPYQALSILKEQALGERDALLCAHLIRLLGEPSKVSAVGRR